MGKLNEIAQKAYECAVRRGKIDPDNDSNNNLHRDLLEEVAEVFECLSLIHISEPTRP